MPFIADRVGRSSWTAGQGDARRARYSRQRPSPRHDLVAPSATSSPRASEGHQLCSSCVAPGTTDAVVQIPLAPGSISRSAPLACPASQTRHRQHHTLPHLTPGDHYSDLALAGTTHSVANSARGHRPSAQEAGLLHPVQSRRRADAGQQERSACERKHGDGALIESPPGRGGGTERQISTTIIVHLVRGSVPGGPTAI